jgi:hypothetical protein
MPIYASDARDKDALMVPFLVRTVANTPDAFRVDEPVLAG